MADIINDVGPVDLGVGYGNPDAANFYGLQKELLRRAAIGRQAQLDEQQRQKDALDAEVKRENLKTSKVVRESQALKNAADTNELNTKQFVQTHAPGDTLSPADQQVALRLFGQGGVNTEPGRPAVTIQGQPAQPAVEAQPAVIGVPDETGAGGGSPAVAAQAAQPATNDVMSPAMPDKTTFAGSDAQRTDEEHKKMAKDILKGVYDTGNETLDQFHKAQALQFLSTGKEGAVPPGVITPKTQSEKDSTRYFNTRAAQAQHQPVSPADAAFADAYEKLHPTEATKQNDAVVRLNISGNLAAGRQEAGFANKAVEGDYNDLRSDYTKNVEPFLQRSVKALDALKSPGGVNDVVAIPEFLSAMAGGQGSGLRMTQSELSMIQHARPGTESVWIKLNNLANGYSALTPEQRQQMAELVKSVATHQIERGDRYAAAMDEMSKAESATDSHKIRTNLMRTDLGDTRSSLGLPPAATSGGFDAAAARKKYGY